MSPKSEQNKIVKFRAKIGSQKRISIPYRLTDFNVGEEVIVTLEKAKGAA